MREAVRRIVILGMLMSCVIMYSCFENVEPGSFTMLLDWDDAPPENLSEMYVWGRVEQNDMRVAETAIVQFEDEANLDFPRVPNGENLVIIIEIKAEQDKKSGTLYFGQSEPFELSAGKHVEVKVLLKLQATPLAEDGEQGGGEKFQRLRIVDENNNDLASTNRVKVRLVLKPTEKSAEILVSNDLAFPDGSYETKKIESENTGSDFFWDSWFICKDSKECTEGVHRVYAKFRDAYGYESDVHLAQVTFDISSPELANEGDAVSPAYAGDKSTVTAVVTPTERLGRAPTLRVAPSDPGFKMDEAPVGESYIFRYLSDANALDGQTYELSVDLVDGAGNEKSGAYLGKFKVDRTPPHAEIMMLSPERVGVVDGNNILELIFEVSEELASYPAVSVGKQDMEIIEFEDLHYSFVYECSGAEEEGLQLLRIQLTDLAGNSSAINLPQTVEFDFSPPGLRSASVSPTYAKLGTQLVVKARLDEAMFEGSEPELLTDLQSWSGPSCDVNSQTWTWTRIVDGRDANRTYDVSIKRLKDALGNATNEDDSLFLGSFSIDALPPTAIGLLLEPQSGKVRIGDVVKVSFSISPGEKLASGYPQAYFGGSDFPMNPVDAVGLGSYAFEHLVSSSDNGLVTVSVDLLDEAGNPRTEIAGTVEVDNRGPLLEIEITPETSVDSPASLGQTISVTLISNEELDINTIEFDGGDFAFIPPSQFGPISNIWKYKVKANDEGGPFFVSVTASDVAGNPAEKAAESEFHVDGSSPKIRISENLRQEMVEQGIYDFRISFNVEDNAIDAISVLLANEGTFTEPMIEQQDGNPTLYNYSLLVDSLGNSDVQSSPLFTVRITASDKAGNQSTEFSNTLQLDTQAPDLVGFDVSPRYVKMHDTVRVILTASQPMREAPSLSAAHENTTIEFNAVGQSKTPRGEISYVYEKNIPEDADEGSYVFSPVVLIDEAGNISPGIIPQSVNANARFIVDDTSPFIEDGGAFPLVVSHDVVASETTFSVSFNVEDTSPVQGMPTVRVGGWLMTKKDQPEAGYAYTYEYTPHKSYPDTHGLKEISISVYDMAGNVASLSRGIAFDFNAPRIVSSICTPSVPEIIPLGAAIVCRATFDEAPMDACLLHAFASQIGGSSRSFDMGTPLNCQQGDLTLTWRHTARAGDAYLGIESDSGKFEATLNGVSDVLGNSSGDFSFGHVFEFDADPPVLDGLEIGGGFTFQDGMHRFSDEDEFNVLSVAFNMSDAYGEATPQLELETASGIVAFDDCSDDGGIYVCTYTFNGLEGDGRRVVRVTAIDGGGNSSKMQTQIECDFSAPAVVAGSVAPHINRTIVYSVTVTEQLGSDPVFDTYPGIPWGGYSMSSVGNQYTWTGEVFTTVSGGGDNGQPLIEIMPSAIYSASLIVCDLVANCTHVATPEIPAFEIDSDIPRIDDLIISGSYVRPNGTKVFGPSDDADRLFVSFSVDDAYGSNTVVVSLEVPGAPAPYEISCNSDSNNYVCPNAPGGGDINGFQVPCFESGIGRVIVNAEDEAGNSDIRRTDIEIDMDAPQILFESINKNLAKLYDDVVFQVTFDETIDVNFKNPTMTAEGFEGAIDFELFSIQEQTLTFRYKIKSGESGVYKFRLGNVCDQLQNCLSALQLDSGFEADSDVPSISNVQVFGGLALNSGMHRFSANTDYRQLQLSFDIEDLYGTNDVSVTMETKNGSVLLYKDTGSELFLYEFNGNEGDGRHNIIIHVQDGAGNFDQAIAVVECDFQNPQVEDSHYTPDPANKGSLVKYFINTDEEIDIESGELTLSGDLGDWGGFVGSGRKFSWTRTKTISSDEHGVHSIALTKLCDKVGNCEEDVPLSPVDVDSRPSSVENLMLCFDDGTSAPCAVLQETFSAQANFNLMKISFDLSEAAENVLPSIGNQELLCENSGLNHICRYVVLDPHNGTIPGMYTKLVSVISIDSAGNADFASQPVTLDFQPPSKVGTPYFERCDQYQPARISQNKLWVKSDLDDMGQPGNYGCNYGLPPDSGQIQISFALTESVQSATRRVFVEGASDLIIDETVSGVDSNYIQAYYADFSNENGLMQVKADVTDMLGNMAILDLGELHFDYQKPNPPDVETEDKIVFTRIPWGSDSTGGEPRISVKGFAGAVDTLDGRIGKVKIYRTDPSLLLAEKDSKNDGSFDEVLLGSDFARLAISSQDLAGNESTLKIIRDTVWISTMGYKIPGSLFENRSIFTTTTSMQDSRDQNSDIESEPFKSEIRKLEKIDGEAIDRSFSKVWKTRMSSGDTLPECWNFTMTFDSVRGRTLLFGCGRQTWGRDGLKGKWSRYYTENAPDSDSACAMTYDGATDRVILFGGETAGKTWEWDGYRQEWVEYAPSTLSPVGRYHPAIAYDASIDRVVLFGGCSNSECTEFLDDTWEWDSHEKSWSPVEKRGALTARYGSRMVYDNDSAKIILFGGYDGSVKNDTWEWDGQSKTWSAVSSEALPPARTLHAMTYDSLRRKVLMFGGQGLSDFLNDMWEYDSVSARWLSLPNGTSFPTTRHKHGMAFDYLLGKAVVFGGVGFDEYLNGDTWEWDALSGRWADRTPYGFSAPGGSMMSPRLVYARNRGVGVLLGNVNPWEWNGTSWRERIPNEGDSNPNFTGRYGYASAFNRSRGNILFYGGQSYQCQEWCMGGSCSYICGFVYHNDFWEWDGMSSTWTSLSPGGTSIGYRYGASMIFDFERNKMILHGGFSVECVCNPLSGECYAPTISAPAGTYGMSGTTWSLLTSSGPGSRMYSLLAYDRKRSVAVMYSGYTIPNCVCTIFGAYCDQGTAKNDTWEWNGTSWTQRQAEGPILSGPITYDEDKNRVIILNQDGVIWEWNGSSGIWEAKESTVNSTPSGWYNSSMIYDEQRNKLALLRINASSGALALSEMDRGVYSKPGALWQIPFAQARAEETEIIEITARAAIGAAGHSGVKYVLRQKNLSWYEAQSACEAIGDGAHLATISSEAEQLEIAAYLNPPVRVWIGMTDEASEGTFTWVDGTPMNYTNWVSGQPDNTAGAEDCGELLVAPGFNPLEWNDAPCTYRQAYLCELGPTEGAQLRIWDGLSWTTVADNYENSSEPGLLEWSTSDSDYITHLLSINQETLNFAIVPRYSGGPSDESASVSVDYIELKVRYRQSGDY